MNFLHQLTSTLLSATGWFLVCVVIFALLARVFTPCNPNQKRWNRDFGTDALYWIGLPFFYSRAQILIMAVLATLLFRLPSEDISQRLLHGWGFFGSLPILAQCALILLFSDILQYWFHRMMHEERWWKFHAIHHAPEEVNWWTAARFHPVNYLISNTLTAALMILVGFSPLAYAALLPFNVLFSGLVHANLNWTFGPFRHVLASPVFHRWHHTAQEEGMNKNFAPTFPFFDVMFGTFYMPEGRVPERYGVEDMPQSFLGQMAYPFRKAQKKTPS